MNKKRWILLAVGLALILTFTLIDFRAAWSQTRAEHEMSTASGGEGLPFLMRGSPHLSVSVTDGQGLNPALQRKVLAALRDSGRFQEVTLLPGIANKANEPYLMARVLEKRVIWTPLYASSRVVIQFGFGSDGNMTQVLTDEPYVVDSINGPSIFSSGKLTLTDTTIGLTSLPGYRGLLANEFAKRIGEVVDTLYQPK